MTVSRKVRNTVMQQSNWIRRPSEDDRELTDVRQMADSFDGQTQLRPGAEMPAFIDCRRHGRHPDLEGIVADAQFQADFLSKQPPVSMQNRIRCFGAVFEGALAMDNDALVVLEDDAAYRHLNILEQLKLVVKPRRFALLKYRARLVSRVTEGNTRASGPAITHLRHLANVEKAFRRGPEPWPRPRRLCLWCL